jgi:glycosyltransferase involved in cell wall biosynthesis
VLFLAHDPGLPSFRYRMAPAIDVLSRQGIPCRVERVPRGRYGRRIWDLRAALREASAVVLAKIQLNPPEAWLLRRFARHLILDIDDAIYAGKPRKPLGDAENSWWRRTKFATTCRSAELVIAGNRHLADVVKPLGTRVEIVPTPVDCDRYRPSKPDPARPLRLVWIGLPENLIYLEMLRPVIEKLQKSWPDLKLRVICSRFPDWGDALIEPVQWSPQSEVPALGSADVGIMPLTDNEWTRGKCAFKLLQYMAAGLPCVASPVGASREAITDEYNGFLATTPSEWHEALRRLLASAELRASFGQRGLERVRDQYDVPGIARRTAALIAAAANSAGPALVK